MEVLMSTISKLKYNIKILTSGLEVFRVGDWGPDQVDSTRKNAF